MNKLTAILAAAMTLASAGADEILFSWTLERGEGRAYILQNMEGKYVIWTADGRRIPATSEYKRKWEASMRNNGWVNTTRTALEAKSREAAEAKARKAQEEELKRIAAVNARNAARQKAANARAALEAEKDKLKAKVAAQVMDQIKNGDPRDSLSVILGAEASLRVIDLIKH